MTSVAGMETIFGVGDELPHGPHRLTREEVAASQRARLMAAIAAVVAEVGYTAATVAQITTRAGVSPRAFYEHFDDKGACYLGAYDAFANFLFARVAQLAPEDEWHDVLAGALKAYLQSLEENPLVARAFLIEIEVAGPAARRRRHESYAAFAALMRERHRAMRECDPSLGALPDRLFLAIVHGVRAMVCHELDVQPEPRLTELADDVLLWITATFEGAAAAREQVHRS